jgi:hypothetical protein
MIHVQVLRNLHPHRDVCILAREWTDPQSRVLQDRRLFGDVELVYAAFYGEVSDRVPIFPCR